MATTPGNAINETTTGICGFTGTAFTGTAVTQHGQLVGGATSSTLTNLGVASNGQLPIGSSGADPTLAVPTSTGGAFTTGAGSLLYIPSNYTDGYSNIGITYSAGTFTVNSASGSAFSATNPGYVVFNNGTTPGQLVTISVTANQTFTDGSGGSTATQRFGLIASDVWGANDIPFFLYAVQKSDQTAIAFMISRNPAAKVAPAAASIGQSGSIVNVGQNDFFSLAAITTSQYAAQPCVFLGCFRMRFVGATNSWTVQTLSTADGIGRNYDNTTFNFPVAVQGAAAGTFFLANGGTAPIYTNQACSYNVMRNGTVTLYYNCNTNSTAGVGAVTAKLTTPYIQPSTFLYNGGAEFIATGSNTIFSFGLESDSTPQPRIMFWQSGIVGFTANTTFAANTQFKITASYEPFLGT